MLRFLLAVLVLLFVVALVIQFKKRYHGLGQALGMFSFVAVVGVWSILQSRSSTAAIGILFLPFYAIFSAILVWLSARFRAAPRPSKRALGWVVLLAACAVPALLVYEGYTSIERNAERDARHRADSQEIARNQMLIKETLAGRPGREVEAVSALLVDHAGERNFLLPLLESRFVTAEALDRMAASDDLGIALTAVRNANCPSATLAIIYRTHAYPDYFFQALAAHQNTPPEILRDIFHRPQSISGLDHAFAGNPATPPEMLSEIVARTSDSSVVQRLLENPKLDCTLLDQLGVALQRSQRPSDDFSVRRMRELKTGHCQSVLPAR